MVTASAAPTAFVGARSMPIAPAAAGAGARLRGSAPSEDVLRKAAWRPSAPLAIPAKTDKEEASTDTSSMCGAVFATLGVGAVARRAALRRRRRAVPRAVATSTEEVAVQSSDSTTYVNKNSVLVLGSTGTLGRQVVRQLLNAGYSVRCMLRNKTDRPFSFLLDWGATVVEGSLARPDTLPSALIGIHMVFDCATAKPEESIYDIDWNGKKAFIQCCEKMQVQRYIFCSIKDCDKYENVPLMRVKFLTEQFLAKSKLRYTTLRITGFMQPLISQYAVNVLDDNPVYADDGSGSGIAYIDSNDCARMVAAAATKERTVGKTLNISGPKSWSTAEVIKLCETLSGREAEVNQVSNNLVVLTQTLASGFLWSIDIAERLRFIEVSSQNKDDTVMSMQDYSLLGMDPEQTRSLDAYIGEYYRRIFKVLTAGKYEPEEGEVEREKEEEDRKLFKALSKDSTDELPPGQPAEKDVSVMEQRKLSELLQTAFEEKQLDYLESSAVSWFGLVPIAEMVNGRSAMAGFSLGLFTEWATGVTVPQQVGLLIDTLSPPS